MMRGCSALAATVLAAQLAAQHVAAEAGCTLTVAMCRNYPEFQRVQFRDQLGEEHLQVGSNDAACLKRAEDMHHWCGNGEGEGAQVGATYNEAQLSQIYHPGACDRGWSQWDSFCYKHFWEKKTWWEAEAACRARESHLASVHSKAENRFVYTLTGGLTAWIGYNDNDQDGKNEWTDSTQDDYQNLAKNCTGREHEPDCQPEETKQQWYNWEGGDRGTYVCKKDARLSLALLRNTTAQILKERPWLTLLPGLAGPDAKLKSELPVATPVATKVEALENVSKPEGCKPEETMVASVSMPNDTTVANVTAAEVSSSLSPKIITTVVSQLQVCRHCGNFSNFSNFSIPDIKATSDGMDLKVPLGMTGPMMMLKGASLF